MDPFDPIVAVEALYGAWQQAEKHNRELPPGSLEAAEALEGANQLWEAYEQALGQGALRPPEAKG